jgi:hypothetical protein
MKAFILVMGVASAFISCDSQERTRLQVKNDSLTYVLAESQKAEIALNEVGVLLDSIDISRHALRANVVEGISYADYISRLEAINTHIKTTQAKLTAMEANAKSAKRSSSATIKRLKADLEARSNEVLELQLNIVALREQNKVLTARMIQKDSIVSSRDEVIRLRTADVASLEGLVHDINEQNRIKVGNLYYAQAAALEEAAKRTKFAPRKKKDTKREALELYRLAYSLGNEAAQERITALEKDLS